MIPRKHLIWALAIVVFDGFMAGLGVFAVIGALVGLILGIVVMASRDVRRGLVILGLYLGACVLVVLAKGFHHRTAHARAQQVIVAVDRYRGERGQYPETLEELVPKYLPAVPRAKYTLWFSEFGYFSRKQTSALLYYTDVPPFGRPTYDFERRSWGYID